MTSFTLSVEQVRSAPPEVRRWIEREVAAALAGTACSLTSSRAPGERDLRAAGALRRTRRDGDVDILVRMVRLEITADHDLASRNFEIDTHPEQTTLLAGGVGIRQRHGTIGSGQKSVRAF